MTTLYLIRHGRVANNKAGCFNGALSDQPLDETGRLQAALLGRHLSHVPFDVICSSPQQRAYQTAEGLCGTRQIPIVTVKALHEINVGDYEGLRRLGVKEFDPHAYEAWTSMPYSSFRFPGGESLAEVGARMTDAITAIVRQYRGRTVAVTSHSAALLLLLTVLYDAPQSGFRHLPHMVNTAYTHLEIDDNGYFRAVRVSAFDHLPPKYHPRRKTDTPMWMTRPHYFDGFDKNNDTYAKKTNIW